MRPNLILVTVECWRGDHSGPYAPNLWQFAKESVCFENAHTAGGWTRISITALLSSAYASMHGGPRVALASPFRRTLAECLLEQGYWTAGFTANPSCGFISGSHRGFGHYRDVRREPQLPAEVPAGREGWPRLLELGISPRDAETFVDAEELTTMALNWLSRLKKDDGPWFLWLHYQDPHWPCQMANQPSTRHDIEDAWEDLCTFRDHVLPSRGTFDPGPTIRDRWATRYRESLLAMDTQAGRLLQNLRARSDWDRTIVAVAGDHGEEFYERGTWHHSWNQLHREGTHVPFFMRIPGTPHWNCSSPVSLLDVAPTLLDYAAIPQPLPMIGQSLRPAIDKHQPPGRPVYAEMLGHTGSSMYRLAIRDGNWLYIHDGEDPQNAKLFDVLRDPEERRNVRKQQGDVFRRFEKMRLAHVVATITGPDGLSSRKCDEPTDAEPLLKDQLVALGYL